MRIKPDRKCQYVETGSTQCASLVRVSRDPWLRIELQAEQARLREAWSEAQHVKSVKALEREAEIRQRARERELFWFRAKATNWGDEKDQGSQARTSSRAIRIANTQSWMPRYATPIRTSQGLLFPFQRTIYRSAKSSKQGAAKHLVRYGADGAHEFNDGSQAFYSSVGHSVDEAAEAFDQLERVNRSAAANAKVVHHMIIQSLHELSHEEQWAMLLRYCDQVFGSQDLPYSVCLHAPSEQGDQRNWHAHVVFSYRPMVRTDEAEWQIGRAIRTDLDCPDQWTRMRYLLCEEFNRTAEDHGINKRYTHLSYAAAGLDYIPQEHLGPGLTEMVRRGEKVGLNEQNLAVVARNSALHALRETRSVLRAGVAAVADYARRERDVILAAIAIQPALSGNNAAAFGIRGVRIPAMPPALDASCQRDEFDAANDDLAAPDRREASSRLGAGVMVPEPLEAWDNAPTGTCELAHFPRPTLPQDLVEPDPSPAIVIAQAPVLPDSLAEAVPPDTTWKAPPTAPAIPMDLSEDEDEETSFSSWFDTRAPTAPLIPEPIEPIKAEGSPADQLTETASLLPAALSTTAEVPSVRSLDAASSARGAPQLPDELDLEAPGSGIAGPAWGIRHHGPLLPAVALPDTGVGGGVFLDPAPSIPSDPARIFPELDLEGHFSMLKPDVPAYPFDLTGRSNSDEVSRSISAAQGAEDAAGVESPDHGETRRKRDGEAKSSQASQRSKGLPPWPWDDGGNDLQ